jgi:hypothetical protein
LEQKNDLDLKKALVPVRVTLLLTTNDSNLTKVFKNNQSKGREDHRYQCFCIYLCMIGVQLVFSNARGATRVLGERGCLGRLEISN